MKLQKRGIAILLVFSILLTSCIGTYGVRAAEKGKEERGPLLTEKKDGRRKEKKSKRTKYSTTYERSDGQQETEFYSSAVRFQDKKSGELVDYEPNLVPLGEPGKTSKGTKLNPYKYENKTGDKKHYFPEKMKKDSPIITEYEDYQISIVPKTVSASAVVLDEKVPVTDLYGKEDEISNAVTYKEVKENMDIKWDSLENGIKESIILKEKPENNRFEYILQAEGCEPKLDVSDKKEKKAATLSFLDKKTGEKVGCIPEAFMTDSSEEGAYSRDCYYTLEKNKKNTYLLTVVVSEEYLADEERVYPVTIDPTVVWQSSGSVDGTYVAAGRQSFMNYGSSDSIVVGRTMNESNWGYIKFPTLYNFCKSKSYIQNGTLTLVETNESEKGKTVRFYKTDSAWNTNTITYNNAPGSASGDSCSSVPTKTE